MSDLVDYAKSELDLAFPPETRDNMQEFINNNILEIVKVFSDQGHSGMSASYVISKLTRLLKFKPLTPLTGEDSEWRDTYGNHQQNIRYSSVFREDKDNNKAYDIDAKVFSDDNGKSWYTNINSRAHITFPYMPPDKPEYVLVNKNEEENTMNSSFEKSTGTTKPGMCSPWVEYVNKVIALFGQDPMITFNWNEEEMLLSLKVRGFAKGSAIAELLPKTKKFGNVELRTEVTIIPENGRDRSEMINDAFCGNPIYDGVVDPQGVNPRPFIFFMFKPEVVQYYNDNLATPSGFTSTLYEELAREIIGSSGSERFCTSPKE